VRIKQLATSLDKYVPNPDLARVEDNRGIDLIDEVFDEFCTLVKEKPMPVRLREAAQLSQHSSLRERLREQLRTWLDDTLTLRVVDKKLEDALENGVQEAISGGSIALGIYVKSENYPNVWKYWRTFESFKNNRAPDFHVAVGTFPSSRPEGKLGITAEPPQEPFILRAPREYNKAAKVLTSNKSTDRWDWQVLLDNCKAFEVEAGVYRAWAAKPNGVGPEAYKKLKADYLNITFVSEEKRFQEVVDSWDYIETILAREEG
jgi:hypothetical protein